jgi:hypothetical protein
VGFCLCSVEVLYVLLKKYSIFTVGAEKKTLFCKVQTGLLCALFLYSEWVGPAFEVEFPLLCEIRSFSFFAQYLLSGACDPSGLFEQKLFDILLRDLRRTNNEIPLSVKREVGMPQFRFDNMNILGQKSGHTA